jgi:hypothetical protein
MKKLVLAGAALMIFSGSVLAQEGGATAPAPAGGGNSVQYKKETKYDFDDDTVEGDMVRPDGEFVDSRKNAKHSSLITIRNNFIPEMLKSVESL